MASILELVVPQLGYFFRKIFDISNRLPNSPPTVRLIIVVTGEEVEIAVNALEEVPGVR